MNSITQHRTSRLLAMLCALLLLVRVDGAHLHLCLDGAESPIALHAVDLRPHHESDVASVAHSDVDLAFPGDAPPRGAESGGEVMVAAVDDRYRTLPIESVSPTCQRIESRTRAPSRYLTPPVCGPPLPRLV